MAILLKELDYSTYESLKAEYQELERKAFEAKRLMDNERLRLAREYFGNTANVPSYEYTKNHEINVQTDDGYSITSYSTYISISKSDENGRVSGSGSYIKNRHGISCRAFSPSGRQIKIKGKKKLMQIEERMKELYEEYAVSDPFEEEVGS